MFITFRMQTEVQYSNIYIHNFFCQPFLIEIGIRKYPVFDVYCSRKSSHIFDITSSHFAPTDFTLRGENITLCSLLYKYYSNFYDPACTEMRTNLYTGRYLEGRLLSVKTDYPTQVLSKYKLPSELCYMYKIFTLSRLKNSETVLWSLFFRGTFPYFHIWE